MEFFFRYASVNTIFAKTKISNLIALIFFIQYLVTGVTQ